MLRIWGRENSINVQKVLWCCGELDIPFQRIDAGGTFGGTNSAEYLTLNPNGLVPTISDNGFVLWEANVIVRYLARKHGLGTLCPEDLTNQAEADRWMDWQMGTVWAGFRPAFIGLIRTPPEKRDWDSINTALRRTSEALAILDRHLADREYVGGKSFTMGDIPLGVTAYRWFDLDIERSTMSNLEAWYDRLCDRLSYRTTVTSPLS